MAVEVQADFLIKLDSDWKEMFQVTNWCVPYLRN